MQRDKYQSVAIANDFQDEFNDINLSDVNFMPYFEVRFMEAIDKTRFDVFATDHVEHADEEPEEAAGWDYFIPIDYEKLSRYIRI